MPDIAFPLLYKAAFRQPAIDNHAHPLLREDMKDSLPFEGVFSEATGDALKDAPYTMATYRGMKQLASLYGLGDAGKATWEELKTFRKGLDYLDLCKRCFQEAGIRCVLMDDGLGGSLSPGEQYKWHDQFTAVKTRRLVRVEVVAEAILMDVFTKVGTPDPIQLLEHFERQLKSKLREFGADGEVVGFKSIVGYRTGLGVELETKVECKKAALIELWHIFDGTGKVRLETKALNDEVVRTALSVAGHCGKPGEFASC